MTNVERVIRFALGAVVLPLGIVAVAAPADGALGVLAWVAAIAGGLDLLISGAVGHCPLYRFVDVPWSRRHGA